MDKRKILIGTGLTIVGGVIIFAVVNKNRNKKLIAEINKILDSGSQATGTSADIAKDVGFNHLYHKQYALRNLKATIYTTVAADKIAKRIYDDVGTVYDNEEDIVAAIKSIPTKTKLSFVSDRFLSVYGKNLGNFIVEHVDKEGNLQQIYKLVKAMPAN